MRTDGERAEPAARARVRGDGEPRAGGRVFPRGAARGRLLLRGVRLPRDAPHADGAGG